MQPLKTLLLIVVTPSGIVAIVKLEHVSNAFCPIVVTVSGIVTDFKERHTLKTELPM